MLFVKQDSIPVGCLPSARPPWGGGSSLSGDFPTETHPLDRDHPGQRAPSPMDSDAPDRAPLPREQMTRASENITLSQTSFAGSNKDCWNTHSSFPLIQPSFVKLTQLAQFDKTSHAWQFMKLVIAWVIGGTESSMAYLGKYQAYNPIWESIRLIILGPGFNSQQTFGQWLKFLTNLTNLTKLLSHSLGKTQLCWLGSTCTSDRDPVIHGLRLMCVR